MIFRNNKTVTLAVSMLLAFPLLLRADNPVEPTEKLVYVKPAGVTQNTRVSTKVRDGGLMNIPKDLNLIILCPEHTGLTVQERPSIFWYMNKPVTGYKCKLAITTDNDPEPLLEKDIDGEKSVGIQRIDLKDLTKALEPNTDYKISVTIINPKNRSGDLQTVGQIRRISAPEKLVSKLLTRPTPAERTIVYAKGGIWYDALSAISDQIAAEKTNKVLYLERAKLFESGDLPEAAAYDKKTGGE